MASRGADDAQTGILRAAEQAHGPGGEGVQKQDGAVGREIHGSRYRADQCLWLPQVDVPEHPREVSSRSLVPVCACGAFSLPNTYAQNRERDCMRSRTPNASTHTHTHTRARAQTRDVRVLLVQEQVADAAACRHAREKGAAKQGLHRRHARGPRQLPRPVRLARTSLFAYLVWVAGG